MFEDVKEAVEFTSIYRRMFSLEQNAEIVYMPWWTVEGIHGIILKQKVQNRIHAKLLSSRYVNPS